MSQTPASTVRTNACCLPWVTAFTAVTENVGAPTFSFWHRTPEARS
jgi:hypothetical protein